MSTLYLICAAVGGALLLLQTALMFLGTDGDGGLDADVDFDTDALDAANAGFLAKLSFKGLVAAATFFGLAGLAGEHGGLGTGLTLTVAVLAGLASIWLVGSLMQSLAHLQSSGNLDLGRAVGARGTVYLPIPGAHGGAGKVTVDVQGRRVQVAAVTAGDELPVGTEVTVLAHNPDALEVARATLTAETT